MSDDRAALTRDRLRDPQSILITGASSGLGAALARHYAMPNRRLSLSGRDRDRLEAVAAACRARGATVTPWVGDVTDRAAMRQWIEAADNADPLDLVIVNAGVSAGTGDAGETEDQARRIFAVNLDGALNTLHPAKDRMVARGRGQIALISSLAGFRGFPGAPAYCASKAAVKAYGEALRIDLKPEGVALSVVCPGFVATPMTAVNRFPMPGLVQPDRAAAIIARGLRRNRARIAFPWPNTFASWLAAALPCAFADMLLARLPTKGSDA
ncbi:MAG: SDR family NAD(P)-dependent oxidoreductase [Alphaproteobacteria bacterium]